VAKGKRRLNTSQWSPQMTSCSKNVHPNQDQHCLRLVTVIWVRRQEPPSPWRK
jgi:hypothetical protein